ncbi:DUF1801 domain-containing protein [Lysinibacillus agricola]|uniref:DUF1801 domain-containing protein n=1 Tax=Lysinibacillus agricola TaxID=2590012 RepID=A0ABX7ATV7_9BACI|nr:MULTISPECIES: DUF1801 domain-containing protein [Lysinibacillus]KOS64491.1 hypothetical protein AN161_02060 [Lysinibacillus sp. FJAT-14222]QQP11644.1 DUF1801 domain-containing protein [Lysinibacillus agricola]
MKPMENLAVETIFSNYPIEYQKPLLQIRELIFNIAEQVSPNETVLESLKWNQPSYTIKSASPLRIDCFEEDKIAIFFHCQTTLVETFREMFPNVLEFSKNRAIVLDPKEELPIGEISVCIQMALTYHRK